VFWIFGIDGLGVIANYFTCFCSTKKPSRTSETDWPEIPEKVFKSPRE
jgi:hypothetical protein